MSTQTHPTTSSARLGRRALLAGALALAATASMVFGVGAASAATIPTSVSIQRVERPAQDVFKGTVSASDATVLPEPPRDPVPRRARGRHEARRRPLRGQRQVEHRRRGRRARRRLLREGTAEGRGSRHVRRCEVGDGHRSVGAPAQHRTSKSSGAASADPLDLRALLSQPRPDDQLRSGGRWIGGTSDAAPLPKVFPATNAPDPWQPSRYRSAASPCSCCRSG